MIHDYVQSGDLKVAQSLWDTVKYKRRDGKLYGFMMNAYIKHKQYDKCLELYREMKQRKMKIEGIAYLIVLKACNKSNNFEATKLIHFEMMKQPSIYKDIKIQNSLIDIYSKHNPSAALRIYNDLSNYKLHPTDVTYLNMLKLVINNKDYFEYGIAIHKEIKNIDQCYQNINIQNALISMYGKCGDFHTAFMIFKDVKNHQITNCKIDDITYLNIIKICSIHKRIKEGRIIHGDVKHLITNIKLQNSLIEMYSNCDEHESAITVFDKMKRKDILSYSLIFNACGKHKDLETGKRIHAEIMYYLENDKLLAESYEFVNNGNEIWIFNALIDMYGKCKDIKESEKLWKFLNSNIKYHQQIDIVSFGTIMNVYASYNSSKYRNNQVLKLFDAAMNHHKLTHNDKTIVIALTACSNLKKLGKGQLIYNTYMNKSKFNNNIIQNVMISLYSNCDQFDESWTIYNDLNVKRMTDNATFVNILNACRIHQKLIEITIIEKDIYTKYENEYDIDIRIYNALLSGYIHCNDMLKSKRVYKRIRELNKQDIITYNTMLQIYLNDDYNNNDTKDDILELWQSIKLDDKVHINGQTYLWFIKVFKSNKDLYCKELDKLKQEFIHNKLLLPNIMQVNIEKELM